MVLTVPEARKRFFGYKQAERPPTTYPRASLALCPAHRWLQADGCFPFTLPQPVDARFHPSPIPRRDPSPPRLAHAPNPLAPTL